MEKVISALEDLKSINSSYGIDVGEIDRLQAEITKAKVCTPIIGKFSSGKSALVNTVLGYSKKILKEDITPETAIPAEIVYTDAEDMITIIGNDGICSRLSTEDYRKYEADAATVKSVRIQLKNSFLEKIPDVMLVDMPGFESGFEIHNKAIDNYLPQSLAYIIAFPADDMIVRSSVGNILKELCLHDMPLCVVITKYDKRNDDFEVTFEKMKESLKRFVGNRKIRYCITNSFTGDAEELKDFLKEIQEKSRNILARKYKKLAMPLVGNTQNYLTTTLNGSQLSESELNEKEEKLHQQLDSLQSKFSSEQQDFNTGISECVEEIKSDVQTAIEAEESTLVAMASNNQNINAHLNSVIRQAVTVSVKRRFVPKVERYLKRVTNTINSESIGDVHISLSFDPDKSDNLGNLSKEMTGGIVAAASAIGGPVFGFIAAAVMAILSSLFAGEQKRDEAKQQIRQKLHAEVFPKVLAEVGSGIENIVAKQIELINSSINDEFTSQRNTLEKAISDLRQKIKDEKDEKEKLAADIKSDLERIEEIKNALQ